jgi:hypothetical protein
MALDITALREALALLAKTGHTDLRSYARVAGQIQLPAVVVLAGTPYVDRNRSMGRGHVIVRLDVAVAVPMANADAGQKQLDNLIPLVIDAILADKTVDGNAEDTTIDTVSAPEDGELSGSGPVLWSILELSFIVSDS